MRSKLSKAEIESIESIQARLEKLWHKLEKSDVELHYGNGTVADCVSCAVAALDSILQEY